jgi:hypothetical protein
MAVRRRANLGSMYFENCFDWGTSWSQVHVTFRFLRSIIVRTHRCRSHSRPRAVCDKSIQHALFLLYISWLDGCHSKSNLDSTHGRFLTVLCYLAVTSSVAQHRWQTKSTSASSTCNNLGRELHDSHVGTLMYGSRCMYLHFLCTFQGSPVDRVTTSAPDEARSIK